MNVANLAVRVRCRSNQADVVRRAEEGLDACARVHVLTAAVLVREREHSALRPGWAVWVFEHRHAMSTRPSIYLLAASLSAHLGNYTA